MSYRPKCSAMFFIRASIEGEVFIDPARFVADPEKAQRFPELPYLTVRLGYLACESFQCRYRACAWFVPSTRRFIAGSFCTRPSREPRSFPGCIKQVGLDGGRFPTIAGKGLGAFSHSCVRVPSSGGCCSSAARRGAVGSRSDAGRLQHHSSGRLGSVAETPEAGPADRRSVARAPAISARGLWAHRPLAFTLAPHLQPINHRGSLFAVGRHLIGSGNASSRLTERSLNHRPVDRITVRKT